MVEIALQASHRSCRCRMLYTLVTKMARSGSGTSCIGKVVLEEERDRADRIGGSCILYDFRNPTLISRMPSWLRVWIRDQCLPQCSQLFKLIHDSRVQTKLKYTELSRTVPNNLEQWKQDSNNLTLFYTKENNPELSESHRLFEIRPADKEIGTTSGHHIHIGYILFCSIHFHDRLVIKRTHGAAFVFLIRSIHRARANVSQG